MQVLAQVIDNLKVTSEEKKVSFFLKINTFEITIQTWQSQREKLLFCERN